MKKLSEGSPYQAKYITTPVVIQTERDDGLPLLVVAAPALDHRCFCPSSLLGEVWLHIIIIHGVSIGTRTRVCAGRGGSLVESARQTNKRKEGTKNLLRDDDVIPITFFRGHNYFYARFEIPADYLHNKLYDRFMLARAKQRRVSITLGGVRSILRIYPFKL